MFADEAIEQMVYDSFDELCQDHAIEGGWVDDGPLGLALVPDPLRLGAAVDLWMRIETREEAARRPIVERTTIFGSSQLQTAVDDDEIDDAEVTMEEGRGDDGQPEPLLDEIELRGRLLVDVLNTASQQLSDRRGALELGEELATLDEVKAALLEAIEVSFGDPRLAQLWENGTFLEVEGD